MENKDEHKINKKLYYILFFYVLIMILDESNFKLNGEVSLVISSAKILILGVANFIFYSVQLGKLEKMSVILETEFFKTNLKGTL